MFFVKLAIVLWVAAFIFKYLIKKTTPTYKMLDRLSQAKREVVYKKMFPIFSFLAILYFVASILAIINSFVALIWFLFIR